MWIFLFFFFHFFFYYWKWEVWCWKRLVPFKFLFIISNAKFYSKSKYLFTCLFFWVVLFRGISSLQVFVCFSFKWRPSKSDLNCFPATFLTTDSSRRGLIMMLMLCWRRACLSPRRCVSQRTDMLETVIISQMVKEAFSPWWPKLRLSWRVSGWSVWV